MRRIVILLLSLLALQANAQFSYSVKAGWSWPDFHDYMTKKEKSSFTFGGSVDYAINKYVGLQSGLNYKRISYVDFYAAGPGSGYNNDDHFTSTMHYAEIPFLFTATPIPTPQRWRAIWNAGMFIDIPVISKGQGCKGKPYYGIMTALQIEILSHYFIRGEYQWALSADEKGKWFKERRTNIPSVTLGYRF